MSNLNPGGLTRVLNYLKTWVTNLLSSKSDTSHSHTWNDIASKPSFANVATSGSYNDLSNKPTIPTVNNATLTIQKNSSNVATFTANASSNVTANISVPTKVSQLTNDSGFLTSHQSLSDYSTKANTVKSLSISGKTITVTPGSGNAYTLTTQDTTYTHPTSSGNKHIPSGGSSGQFLGWSADGTAKWVNNPNTNTWTAMVGATSSANGSVGYVNAVPPKDGYNTKYLRADGTWQVPPDHTYTVNNATLTIQKNGSNVATFTANASSNVTANITVPTVNNATLTIQKNGSNVATFTSNASSNVTANITVPTNTNQLTNGNGFITSEIDSSGTGWVRFKSGVQFCYGAVNNSNGLGTGLTRFSFPKAFNTKPNVIVTPDISARYIVTASVEGKSTWVLNTYGAYGSPIDYVADSLKVSYIAIGTWK